MNARPLAAWLLGLMVLGSGATLLLAQQPPPPRIAPADIEKIRARIVELRTEVEMLQVDYDIARDGLMDRVKTIRGLQMAGEMMQFGFAIQSAINDASNPNQAAPKPPEDAKPQAEVARQAEKEQQEQAEADRQAKAELASLVADEKKELSRLFTRLAEKRLDLEDAERAYRETVR